jgi:hypothetical protein
MSTVEAQMLATETLTLCRAHAHKPALDVLDLVMKDRRHRLPEFGELALPPAPFALVVAEALDGGMTADEWALMTGFRADPALRTAVLDLWAAEVWPRFVQRYGVG